jgi:fumarate hydratase, class I
VKTKIEELRVELLDKVNALGIGAQGLGGLTTVLDIKIKDYPTHAASLPVAVIPNCAATRHAHFVLDGSGPATLDPPDLDAWPKLEFKAAADARRVESRYADGRGSGSVEAGRAPLAVGQDAHGP